MSECYIHYLKKKNSISDCKIFDDNSYLDNFIGKGMLLC